MAVANVLQSMTRDFFPKIFHVEKERKISWPPNSPNQPKIHRKQIFPLSGGCDLELSAMTVRNSPSLSSFKTNHKRLGTKMTETSL